MKKCESCANKSSVGDELPCLKCRVQFPGNRTLESAYTEEEPTKPGNTLTEVN
jgi:hypothetical protein